MLDPRPPGRLPSILDRAHTFRPHLSCRDEQRGEAPHLEPTRGARVRHHPALSNVAARRRDALYLSAVNASLKSQACAGLLRAGYVHVAVNRGPLSKSLRSSLASRRVGSAFTPMNGTPSASSRARGDSVLVGSIQVNPDAGTPVL